MYPYESPKPVSVGDIFDTRVYSSSTGLSTEARFVVVENDNAGSLLGIRKDTDFALGLLRVGPARWRYGRSCKVPPGQRVPRVVSRRSSGHAIRQYFRGSLKNCQLKVHTDPKVTPVAQPLRRTPFHSVRLSTRNYSSLPISISLKMLTVLPRGYPP